MEAESNVNVTQRNIPIMRSGQTMNETFLSSVVKAYSNIAYQPVLLIAVAFLVLMIITELNNDNGPIEDLIKELNSFTSDKNLATWEVNIIKVVVKFLRLVIDNKVRIIKTLLVSVPAVAKPSTKNIVASSILVVAVLVWKKFTIMEVLVFSQLWFLFTQIRNPTFKMIILLIGALAVYYYFFSKQEGNADDNKTPSPAPGNLRKRRFSPPPNVASTTPKIVASSTPTPNVVPSADTGTKKI